MEVQQFAENYWMFGIAALAGAPLPENPIDGRDIWPLLAGQSTRTPHEAFYYYHADQLQAVRSGKWKLYLPLFPRRNALPAKGVNTTPSPPRLYDVVTDPGETKDLAAAHSDVVARLLKLAEQK